MPICMLLRQALDDCFLYPEAQKYSQKEIDAHARPDYTDHPRLRHVDALCKEVMRCGMETPVGC